MRLARGDVVVLEFPQAPAQPPKRRPAVVVQSDRNNGRLTSSIFAMVSSNTRVAHREPAQVLIDLATAEGRESGLSKTSAVKCENLYTLPQHIVRRKIGRLTPALMQRVDAALKAALGVA